MGFNMHDDDEGRLNSFYWLIMWWPWLSDYQWLSWLLVSLLMMIVIGWFMVIIDGGLGDDRLVYD